MQNMQLQRQRGPFWAYFGKYNRRSACNTAHAMRNECTHSAMKAMVMGILIETDRCSLGFGGEAHLPLR